MCSFVYLDYEGDIVYIFCKGSKSPLVLFGHTSLGDIISIQYALNNPGIIGALNNIDTPGPDIQVALIKQLRYPMCP